MAHWKLNKYIGVFVASIRRVKHQMLVEDTWRRSPDD